LAQYDINLREYWRILKKRKFVVILITIVLGLFSTSFAILKAPNPLYTATCSIKFEKETTMEGLYARTITWSGGDDIETQITVIKSYPVFQRVAQELGILQRKGEKGGELKQDVARIAEGLQSKVEVERENLTNILHIRATDSSALFAQRLANSTALTYKELHAEEQMKRTTEALRYIREQLTAVREKLRISEEEFNKFSQKNQLISLDLQSEVLLARSQEIQNEIRQVREDKGELQGIAIRLKQFIKDPNGSGHDFYSTKATAQYQGTNDSLVSLLLKKDTLLEDYTPYHPEVVAISRKIIENARKMGILLELQLTGLEKKEIELKKELETVDHKTQVLMDKKLEFDRLKRRVDSYNDMTALLERKNQEALIRQAEKPEEITIVKPALTPTAPINPPKTMATGALGILIGLVLGIVIGFVVETFDTSLGAIEDVEETLGTQVLGIVPQADAKDIREALREKYPDGIKESSEKKLVYLVSHFVPKSMMAESFRALRTNIQFKEAERKIETIGIASTSPEEGKTLVAVNLAVTIAQAGMKVLLVGSDLRKPAIDKVFGVEMTPGLTDVLMGNYPWRDTVKTVTDIIMGQMSTDEVMMTPGLDNLHLITSGPIPPNPAELIESERLTAFIEEAKKEYDVILFDSTPILSTADAAILGTKVDGVLMVYRVGTVSRGLLRRSTAQLRQVKCNIMGVVLNGMRPDVSPDFQDYKYYSYAYAYGAEEKHRKRGESKRLFSLIGKKREPKTGEEQRIPAGEEGARLRDKGAKGRGLNKRKAFLLLVAVALLTGGVLWQSGIIDPFKHQDRTASIKKDEVGSAGKKKRSPKRAVQGKPKTVSQKPKRALPGTKGQRQVKKSISGSHAVTKPLTDERKPIVKEGASKKVLLKKPAKIGSKQGPAVAAEHDVKNAIPSQNKILKRPSERQPQDISPGPRPLVVEKKAPIVSRPPPPKEDASKKPIEGKPATSAQPRRPLTAKKTQPQPVPVAPKSAPTSKPVVVTKASAPTAETPSHPYSIYLGSFRTLDRAKKAVSQYSKRGLSPYCSKVDFREKGIWFRVFAGHFQDRRKAKQFKKRHRLREGTVKKTAYANLIGTYKDSSELEEKHLSLRRSGYFPYVIKGGDGESRLYVGAFITREGAEQQYHDLKSRGIQSEIVKR
jgi:succinoglycan biosynthesis transport protein ExoP